MGPTGYGLKRLIEDMGHACAVIAPSLIPRRLGERVKTNRRDAAELGETVDRLICEEDMCALSVRYAQKLVTAVIRRRFEVA